MEIPLTSAKPKINEISLSASGERKNALLITLKSEKANNIDICLSLGLKQANFVSKKKREFDIQCCKAPLDSLAHVH